MTQSRKAKKFDAKLRSLVGARDRNMAEIAYLLLEMRNPEVLRALNESTIANYAVNRGVTRSKAQARELVLVAERVQRWPRLKAAFDRGVLDWTKVRDALRLLERIGGSKKDERRLLRRILECTSRELEREFGRAAGRDVPTDVTHLLGRSRERQARLEHALRVARARGNGAETDEEALARIIDDWLVLVGAAVTEEGAERNPERVEPDPAQASNGSELVSGQARPGAGRQEPAPAEPPASGDHASRLRGAAAMSQTLVPADDGLHIRVADSEVEVRIANGSMLIGMPGRTAVSLTVAEREAEGTRAPSEDAARPWRPGAASRTGSGAGHSPSQDGSREAPCASRDAPADAPREAPTDALAPHMHAGHASGDAAPVAVPASAAALASELRVGDVG
jgi:hypothetical protein